MDSRQKKDRTDERSDRAREDGNVVIELDDAPLTADRAAQYQDWVERMYRKRESNQQHILSGEVDDDEAPSYWRAEDVFRESQRLTGELSPRSDPRTEEMLAVLGLSGEPSMREVELAFRRLAMEHHPDRHVTADDSTRAQHLEQMRRINDAYALLRRRQSD